MDSFLLLDFFVKLFYVAITMLFLFAIVRLADKLIKINFKEEFEKVKRDEKALSIYFGCRLIAIAIIVSSFF